MPDFSSFSAAMARVSEGGAAARFFVYCTRMFFRRYAEQAYYDAAVWGRRLAEVYCLVLLQVFQQELDNSFHGLYELSNDLPEWVWAYSAYAHVSACASGEYKAVAERLGMPLSREDVYGDLSTLRKYGNKGAHASRYLNGDRLKPDPRSVVAVFRVAMSFAAWTWRCSRL